MGSCTDCTKLRPIVKGDNCATKEEKIEDVRIYCPEDITETLLASPNGDCDPGYVSSMVLVVALSTPLVAIDVLNPEDLDELNDYTFDRDADFGEDNYSFTPLKIKVYNPDHQCTLDSMKGQDVAIVYKITNRDGEFIWRRLLMKLVGVTGGIVDGYELTFDVESPNEADKPLWVNFGTAAATTTALDVITVFS